MKQFNLTKYKFQDTTGDLVENYSDEKLLIDMMFSKGRYREISEMFLYKKGIFVNALRGTHSCHKEDHQALQQDSLPMQSKSSGNGY